MALKPLTLPYVVKDATFTVAADDYTAHISEVRFSPSSSAQTWKGIGGNTVRDQAPAEWTCTTGMIQDADEDGFHRYLLENEGQKKAVVFTPLTGGDPVYATLVLTAPEIGGAADAFATASVTHPVDGRPSYTEPTP